jgi:hypothetical protein
MKKILLGVTATAAVALAVPAGASATVYSCPTFQVVKNDPTAKLQAGTYGRRIYEPNSGRNRPWTTRTAACNASYHLLYSFLYNPRVPGYRVKYIGRPNSAGLYSTVQFISTANSNVFINVIRLNSTNRGTFGRGQFTG